MRPTILSIATVLLAPALFGVSGTLGAQQDSSFATLAGSVTDSIHGAVPLVGATVRVEPAGRQAVTDSLGAFRIDSIPVGEHRLVLLHPLLDTLSIQIATRPGMIPPGETGGIHLAVPSAHRVIELSCTPAWRSRGPSALVGKVLDADSEKPLAGARVSLVWHELSLQTLRREQRVREATVGEDGSYRICGLPAGLEGTVQASFNDQRTAEVRILVEETSPLAFQSLRIGTAVVVTEAPRDTSGRAPSPVAGDTTTRRLMGAARLTGRVVNAAGAPVANARVDVQGTGAAMLSRQDGTFGFTDLPSGTQAVVVRQLGFEPVEVAVELSARQPRQVTVTMAKAARVIEPVVVRAERDAPGLDKVGFSDRKKMGFGYFLGPEDLENRNAGRMTDIFRQIPTLRVVPSGMDYVVESARDAAGGCVRYVVDGAPYHSLFPGDVDRIMPPHEVAAIEVYAPSAVPVQFQSAGASGCTTIVMWSRFRVRRDR